MTLFKQLRKAVLVRVGPIPVLRFGCMLILVRCRQYGNLIHAVIGLQINLRRLRDRNILRRIRIFTANWCSMGMKRRQLIGHNFGQRKRAIASNFHRRNSSFLFMAHSCEPKSARSLPQPQCRRPPWPPRPPRPYSGERG